jgi:hypothetical protein
MSKRTRNILGSIGTIVLLIFVSFTNVVGIQSTTSDSENNSPLFNIRTNKATNDENNRIIISNYLGKGVNALSFSLQDNKTSLIRSFIRRVKTMDDESFNHIIINAFYQIRQKNVFREISPQKLVTTLYQLRGSLNIEKAFLNHIEINNKYHAPARDEYGSLGDWIPGCFLYNLLWIVCEMIFDILAKIGITIDENCLTSSCTIDCTNDHGCTYPKF